MKSNIDLESKRLAREQARKLLSEILSSSPNFVSYSRYFKQRMHERNMTTGDIINVLHKGEVLEGEFEKEQWRYRVQTSKMTVVITFVNPSYFRCISCWRD